MPSGGGIGRHLCGSPSRELGPRAPRGPRRSEVRGRACRAEDDRLPGYARGPAPERRFAELRPVLEPVPWGGGWCAAHRKQGATPRRYHARRKLPSRAEHRPADHGGMPAPPPRRNRCELGTCPVAGRRPAAARRPGRRSEPQHNPAAADRRFVVPRVVPLACGRGSSAPTGPEVPYGRGPRRLGGGAHGDAANRLTCPPAHGGPGARAHGRSGARTRGPADPRTRGPVYGKETTLLGVVLDAVTAPVSLMTWVMVPTPPSETVSASWNFTPGVFGTSKAW